MRVLLKIMIALSVSSTLAGCGDEMSVVTVGAIEHYGAPLMIQAPTSAKQGQSFTVQVTTYGDGCVSSDSTDVALAAESADVTPYDRERTPASNEGCTQGLYQLAHQAQVSFDTTGDKTIRIHGRHLDANVDEMVERTVMVVIE